MKISAINIYSILQLKNKYENKKNNIIFKGEINKDSFEQTVKYSQSEVKNRLEEEIKNKQNLYTQLNQQKQKLEKEQEIIEILYNGETSNDFKDMTDFLKKETLSLNKKRKETQDISKLIKYSYLYTSYEKLVDCIKIYSPKQYELIDEKTSLSTLLRYVEPIKKSLDEEVLIQEADYNKKLEQSIAEFLKKYPKLKLNGEILEDIIKTVCTSSYTDFEYISKVYEKKINKIEKETSNTREKIDKSKNQLKLFDKISRQNPKLAPLYDPYLGVKEKRSLLIALKGCIDEKSLEDQIGQYNVFKLAQMGLIKYVPLDSYRVIDLTDAKTKEITDMLKAKKETLKTPKVIAMQYDISPLALEELDLSRVIFKAQPDALKPDLILEFIDLSDKKTVEAIEKEAQKSEKTKPKKSKYFYDEKTNPKELYIPIVQLDRLGFGTSARLKKMVLNKELSGTIEKKMTPQGEKTKTLVNLADENNREILRKIKKETTHIKTLVQFARETRLTQKDILEALKDEKAEIIPQYIFKEDSKTPLIDLRNPKNIDFQNKVLFEKLIKEKIKQQEDENSKNKIGFCMQDYKTFQSKLLSAKMMLVWYLSKNIAQNALESANKNQIKELLIKEFDNKELNEEEKTKIENYFSEFWNQTQIEELNQNFKQAQEMIDLYFQKKTNLIKNSYIKEILNAYLKD